MKSAVTFDTTQTGFHTHPDGLSSLDDLERDGLLDP